MTFKKPMRAVDAVEEKIVYPVYVQPKYDGVRGICIDGKLTGRSLKPFKNKHVTATWSLPEFAGMDGEFIYGPADAQDACRATSSVLSRIEGTPEVAWYVFDYVHPMCAHVSYNARITLLAIHLERLREEHKANQLHPVHRIQIVTSRLVFSHDELLDSEAEFLSAGYEGLIIRKFDGLHKNGYSTVKEGGLLRIKRFIDAEAECLELREGDQNNNVAQTNELGMTFRSSHQENKTPNGMVGSLLCRVLVDVYDPTKPGAPEKVLEAGQVITVSPGEMDHKMRGHYWRNQSELVGRIVKFKFFPKGIKDKPRFPTFQSIRNVEDM